MTKTWARRSVQAGALAAGFILFSGGAAQANDAVTHDNIGAGNGNQVVAPVQTPVDVCGNAAAAGGQAGAYCDGGSSASLDSGVLGDMHSHDNIGIGNGNQVQAPIQAPVNVCGNAGSLVGQAGAACDGGADAEITEAGSAEDAPVTEQGAHASMQGGGADMHTHDNIGIGNGNQVYAPIQAPVNACGNAVAVLGQAAAGCEGGASAELTGGGGDMHSHDNIGIGNGNQVQAPIQAPVNICGNAVAVLGQAVASCGAEDDGKGKGHDKDGKLETAEAGQEEVLPTDTVATGLPTDDLPVVGELTGGELPTDGIVDADVPMNDAPAPAEDPVADDQVEEHGPAGDDADMHSHDNIGIGNGNQVYAPIQAPINVSGNSVAVLGQSFAASEGGADATLES